MEEDIPTQTEEVTELVPDAAKAWIEFTKKIKEWMQSGWFSWRRKKLQEYNLKLCFKRAMTTWELIEKEDGILE